MKLFLFKDQNTINDDFELNGAAIDTIAALIDDYLTSLKMDRSSKVRIRLSIEEALLRWMDRFGVGAQVHMSIGTSMRKPTITLMLTGDQYNPLVSSENDLGEWAESLFTGVSLSPTYAYRRGVNILQLRMSKPETNPALKLLLSVLVGGIFGLLGKLLLPDSIMSHIVLTILSPIQNLFLRILNASSSPIIFLSVITATCAIGSMTAIGKSGRRMAVRFISITLLVTLVTTLLSLIPLNIHISDTVLDETQFSSILDLFLQTIPNDVLTPIISGNSPQMIIIALIIGNALLTAGPRAEKLQTVIEQADSIGLIIAGWVSRLSPVFVSILLVLGIWDGSIAIFVGLWKPFLMIALFAGAALVLSVLKISRNKKVPVQLLIKKMKPSFMLALRTASVDYAIAENMNCCEKKLGISKKLSGFGVPLGLISFMPAAGIATIILVLYAAKACSVKITIVWLITAVALTVALTAATPPVSGVGILTYTVLFAQLNIPLAALTMAMAADILIGFIITPINQAMLQMELISEAATLDLLDRSILQKD